MAIIYWVFRIIVVVWLLRIALRLIKGMLMELK